MQIDIPTSWDNALLDGLNDQARNRETFQIYGALPSAFPTGRPDDVPQVDRDTAVQHFKYAKKLSIETNYLINGSKGGQYFTQNLEQVRKYFNWVTQDLCPDLITVSDPKLQIALYREFGWESFCVSAITGIQDQRGLENWLESTRDCGTVHSLVLHHDLTQSEWQKVQELAEAARNYDILAKLMLTESCYGGCKVRQAHYAFFGQPPKSRPLHDPFQVSCMLKRLADPTSLLDLAGFITPEELHSTCKKFGIRGFKVTGRSCSAAWIERASRHYLSGKSPKNLFELIVFTSPLLREEFDMEVDQLFYLDSGAYGEYIIQFRELQLKDRKAFKEETAARLFSEGLLKINDPGSNYHVCNGKLLAKYPGQYMTRLKSLIFEGKKDKSTIQIARTILEG